MNFNLTTTSLLAAEEGFRPETAVPLKEALGPRVGNKVVLYTTHSHILLLLLSTLRIKSSWSKKSLNGPLHGLDVSDQRGTFNVG